MRLFKRPVPLRLIVVTSHKGDNVFFHIGIAPSMDEFLKRVPDPVTYHLCNVPVTMANCFKQVTTIANGTIIDI